jgi:nucleotide-binding universal stress UspA family protein
MASTTSQLEPRAHGHHVLVCLDGSPGAEVSLPYAIGIAKTFGSTVTLVRVLSHKRTEQLGSHTSDVVGWEIARREASGYLERVQNGISGALGQRVDVRLEQGLPAERIVDLARDIGADLIVLSSHGEGAGACTNLGTTVQQVLALARSSVFVVHRSPAPAAVLPKRLLVPLDGSLRSESVLPTAARIARAYEADLLLVHVVQEPLPTLVLHTREDLALAHELALRLELAATRYLEGLRDRLTHESTAVRMLVVRHANERQALLDVSSRERADLIVLSAHGSACDPVHSFGSVTTDLLAHSPLPMLVLQDLPNETWSRQAASHSSAPPLRASFPPEAE